ncbi:hypothetical protein, partial [Pseudomonas syringae group genomosp. 3]|uniref:hypothetical protein n=1 Tax=Pseudomonas syringae group genomosp. 3 TaxID=251701 RepID=UPI001C825B04
PCKTQLVSEAFLLLTLKHRRSLLTRLSIIPTSQAWQQGLSNNEGKTNTKKINLVSMVAEYSLLQVNILQTLRLQHGIS